MKLTDLNPRWIGRDGTFTPDASDGGCGVAFDCPGCRKHTIAVHFDKPLDGGRARSTRSWDRTGETFDTLTLTPSILESISNGAGALIECWHGFVTNGEIVTC